VVLFNDVPCRWCYKSLCPKRHYLRLRGVEPAAVVPAALQLLRDSDAVAEASPFGGRSASRSLV
jgi:hypothetical protein